jgi:hypothetical protein
MGGWGGEQGVQGVLQSQYALAKVVQFTAQGVAGVASGVFHRDHPPKKRQGRVMPCRHSQ